MTLVAVDRALLDVLLRECYAVLSGSETLDITDCLHHGDPLVRLAVQAGLQIPGPMAPGHVPPAPPPWLGRLTAPTYRDADDGRLRCTECGKVVYGNNAQAGKASALISTERQAMRTYLGPCGHYHLSRVKGDRR